MLRFLTTFPMTYFDYPWALYLELACPYALIDTARRICAYVVSVLTPTHKEHSRETIG